MYAVSTAFMPSTMWLAAVPTKTVQTIQAVQTVQAQVRGVEHVRAVASARDAMTLGWADEDEVPHF